MKEKLCPKCGESLLAWERVPHTRAVEKAIRKGKEPQSKSYGDPTVIYCGKCGNIIKIKYVNVSHGSHVVVI